MIRLLLLLSCATLAGCSPSRASPAELQQVVEAMRLQPGMHVADVGTGDGTWSETLAREVGAEGHVYATEVDEEDVEQLRERLESAGLDNTTVILGDDESTGLPDDCCDAILLRRVYHHFTDPPSMRASLRAALRPGALLVAVEILPQPGWDPLPGVPERDGHGISVEDLVEELTSDGFEVVARYDEWEGDDDHYGVVFRPVEEPAPGPAIDLTLTNGIYGGSRYRLVLGRTLKLLENGAEKAEISLPVADEEVKNFSLSGIAETPAGFTISTEWGGGNYFYRRAFHFAFRDDTFLLERITIHNYRHPTDEEERREETIAPGIPIGEFELRTFIVNE